MIKISILDTSIGTLNIGDEIIVDAVIKELKKIFNKNTMFIRLPTHERISRYSHSIIRNSNLSFVAGTNLLTSSHKLLRGNSWRIGILDAFSFKNVVLMGVGWTNYQKKPTWLTNLIYNKALTKKYIHSVRDNYTKEKLKSIGITNVLNTGCPTMWELTPEHCKNIPVKKAKNVMFTLTDYRQDPEKDSKLIDILIKNYEKVYFWVQGSGDYEYIKSLLSKEKLDSIIFVDPTLEDYDTILESEEDLEYVGTRLHAGIRALQKKRRCLIIGVDNRALEKQKDFNLNVLNRENISQLEKRLYIDIPTEITLAQDAIQSWRSQFAEIVKEQF